MFPSCILSKVLKMTFFTSEKSTRSRGKGLLELSYHISRVSGRMNFVLIYSWSTLKAPKIVNFYNFLWPMKRLCVLSIVWIGAFKISALTLLVEKSELIWSSLPVCKRLEWTKNYLKTKEGRLIFKSKKNSLKSNFASPLRLFIAIPDSPFSLSGTMDIRSAIISLSVCSSHFFICLKLNIVRWKSLAKFRAILN